MISLIKRLAKGSLSDPAAKITAAEHDANMSAIEGAVNSVTDGAPDASLLGRAKGAGTGTSSFLDETAIRTIIGLYTSTQRGVVPASGVQDHSLVLWDDGWAAPSEFAPHTHELADITDAGTAAALDADDVLQTADIGVSVAAADHTHALEDIDDAGALAALDTISAGEIDPGAGQGDKIFEGIETAASPTTGVSTNTLSASTGVLLVDDGSTTVVRINDPAARRTLKVQNNTGGAIEIEAGDETQIIAAVPDKHEAQINFSGTANTWVAGPVRILEGGAPASGGPYTIREFTGTVTPDANVIYEAFAHDQDPGGADLDLEFTKGAGSFHGATHFLTLTVVDAAGSTLVWNAGFESIDGADLPLALAQGEYKITFFYDGDADAWQVAFANAVDGTGVIGLTAPTGYTAGGSGDNVTGHLEGIDTALQAKLPLAGGTMSGEINCADQLVTRPELKDYAETSTSPTNSAGTVVLDLAAGNAFQHTLTANVTTLTISNPPASGKVGTLVLKVTQDSTARTIAWPASFHWAGGTPPTLSAASGAIDIFSAITWDAGTSWFAMSGGQAFAVPA